MNTANSLINLCVCKKLFYSKKIIFNRKKSTLSIDSVFKSLIYVQSAVILICFTSIGFSQQLQHWSLPNDNSINFSPNSNTINNSLYDNGNPSTSVDRFYNCMHKADGTLWFFINEEGVFDENGSLFFNFNGVINQASYHVQRFENMSEIGIVPVPGSCDKFYIIGAGWYYYFEPCNNFWNGPHYFSNFDKVGNNTSVPYAFASGVAISNIRLTPYPHHIVILHNEQQITFYELNATGFTYIGELHSQNFNFLAQYFNFSPESECVDLQNGNIRYAIVWPKGANAPDIIDDVRILIADFNFGAGPPYTTPTNFHVGYEMANSNALPGGPLIVPMGLEFNNDGSRLFITANTFIGTQPSLYYLDLSSGLNAITENVIANNSVDNQWSTLELARDGNIYLRFDNTLARITDVNTTPVYNPNFATITSQAINTHALGQILTDNIASPDQIDGFNMNDAIGTVPFLVNNANSVDACFDSPYLLSASLGFCGYLWSTSETTQAIAVTNAGTYTVTVTYGCNMTYSTSIIVNVSPLLSTLTGSTTICENSNAGTLTVTNTGASPFTYLWSNGQTTVTANGLAAGTYTVTVTDINGCTASASATIVNYPEFTLSTLSGEDCQGLGQGILQVDVSPPGTYTYLWNTGSTLSTVSQLFAGTYTCTVTDINGCTKTATVEILDLSDANPIISGSSFTACSESASGQQYIDLAIDNYINDPNYVYTWTATNGIVLTVSGQTASAICVNGIGGTVTVSLSAFGCDYVTNYYIQDCCESLPPLLDGITHVDILASDLIALYGNPMNTNNYLFFNGTLTVDIPFFEIMNCQFLHFGPAAKIICLPTTTLQIKNSHLKACSSMWFGIEMGHNSNVILKDNIIEDAQYAVKATDNCQTILVNNDMNDNFVSYYVEPNVSPQMISGSIQENRFSTVNQLVQPYLGQTPAISTHSFAGIWINDVTALTIGSFNPTLPKNIFTNLNNGIISNRANLTSRYNIFNDISIKGGYNNLTNTTLYNHSGTGITAYGGIGYTADISGDAGPGNAIEFMNCFYGIYVDALEAKVYDHQFTSNNITGINHIGVTVVNMNHVLTEVYKNTIYATRFGIRATENYNAVHIYDNTITINNLANNTFFRTGISISNFTTTIGAVINVHHNQIYMNDARRGIRLRNVAGAWVHENEVWMLYPNIYHAGGVYDYGILAENSPNCIVDCNNVTGNFYQGDPGAKPQTFAFAWNLSTDNIVSCNISDNTDVGFNFTGACNNTDFKGNQIDRHWAGLRLASAVFGQQHDKGNLWSTSHIYPKYGAWLDVSFPPGNEIFTPTVLPFTPSNNGGVNWFNPPNVTPYVCSNFYCSAPFRIGGDSSVINEDELRAINSDTIVAEFNPQVSDDTKKRLFKKIQNNTNLLNANNDIAQFYLEAQSNDIGTANAVKNKTSEIEDLLTNNASLYNPLVNAQNTLLMQLRTNDSIINATNDSSLQMVLMVQNKNLAKQVDSLKLQINAIANGEKAIENHKYDEAKLINEGMLAQEIYDYNFSVINNIYLSTIAKNNFQLSAEQINEVVSIATVCPLIGGPAVYLARSIAELFDENIVYNDEAVCLSQGVNMKLMNNDEQEHVETINTVNVYPIPSKDVVHFEFGSNHFEIMLIFDSYGKQIQRIKLNNEQQYLLLTNLYANGIYRYKLVNSKAEVTGKIVILK